MNDQSTYGKDWTNMIPHDLMIEPHRDKNRPYCRKKKIKNRIFMIKMSIISIKVLSSMLITM